jgi:hypothetical protein
MLSGFARHLNAARGRVDRLTAKLANVDAGGETSDLLSQYDLRLLVALQLADARRELERLRSWTTCAS